MFLDYKDSYISVFGFEEKQAIEPFLLQFAYHAMISVLGFEDKQAIEPFLLEFAYQTMISVLNPKKPGLFGMSKAWGPGHSGVISIKSGS